MSYLFKFAYAFLFLLSALVSKSQTLGNYPNTSVIAGQNVMITPDALPSATTSIVAYTNTNFSGILTVNPVTGILQVTNAKQAGTYLVTVKAFGALYLRVGGRPEQLVIADFNGDGKQDFASVSRVSRTVSIRIGNIEGKNTWLGLTSEWNKPSNWSLGIIPSACGKAVVNTGVPFLPTITGINNTCFSLTLNNEATINMAPGANLNITGK